MVTPDMPALDPRSAEIIARLPPEVRDAVRACLTDLADLDLEGWRIALACLLAEYQIAEARAASGGRLQ
jgi:hypothetical protein